MLMVASSTSRRLWFYFLSALFTSLSVLRSHTFQTSAVVILKLASQKPQLSGVLSIGVRWVVSNGTRGYYVVLAGIKWYYEVLAGTR